MICLSYQKQSPLFNRYRQLNGIVGFSVGKDEGEPLPWRAVAVGRADGFGGFPGEPMRTRREALELAKCCAEHCQLPYIYAN